MFPPKGVFIHVRDMNEQQVGLLVGLVVGFVQKPIAGYMSARVGRTLPHGKPGVGLGTEKE